MAEPDGEAGAQDRKALDELGARIDGARNRLSGKRPKPPNKYGALSIAWRMVLELVLGVVIGASIGYALDWAFGTKPVMMMIFGGLGFAAGIKTMVRTSREINRGR